MRQAKSKYAMHVLAWTSVFESIFLLIPSDLLIMAIGISDKKKAFKAAAIATIFSVVGGLLAYIIGAFMYDTVGVWLIDKLGYADKFVEFASHYAKYGVLIVIVGALTPFPYKVITIASGFVGMNVLLFIVASLIARALRYFLIALLIYKMGEKAREFIEKHLWWLSILFVLVLFGSFLLIKYI